MICMLMGLLTRAYSVTLLNILAQMRQKTYFVLEEISTKKIAGPGCSKLATLLVNVSLKFQTLISDLHQYFLLKKCEKLLQCKSFSHFATKISV